MSAFWLALPLVAQIAVGIALGAVLAVPLAILISRRLRTVRRTQSVPAEPVTHPDHEDRLDAYFRKELDDDTAA